MILSPFYFSKKKKKSEQEAKSSLYTHLPYVSTETGVDNTNYLPFFFKFYFFKEFEL